MRSIISLAEKETRELNAEEIAAFDDAENIVENIEKELAAREKNGNPNGRMPGGGMGGPSHSDPKASHLMLGPKDRFADRIESGPSDGPGLVELLRASVTGEWNGLENFRAQSSGSASTGGFLVPQYLSARIIDLARNQARVIQAGAMSIPVSGPTTFAAVDGDVESHWRAENEEIPESDEIFSGRNFTPQVLAALVRCSVELIEDAPNIQQLVEDSISASLGLQLDKMCLVGDGIGKPLGLLNAPGITILSPAGGAGALTNYNLLSQAVEAVRNNNVEPGDFLLASRTSGEIDRLVNSLGDPLSPPPSVAERELLTTNQIPVNMAAGEEVNASAIFTGYWPDLYIAMRTNIVLEATRVADDTFSKMQVLIRGYLRCDAFPVRPNHFAAITGITPPV